MQDTPETIREAAAGARRAATRLNIVFWISVYLLRTAWSALGGLETMEANLARIVVNVTAGFLVTQAVMWVLDRLAPVNVVRRTLLGLVLVALATCVYAYAVLWVEYFSSYRPPAGPFALPRFLRGVIYWLYIFLAWLGLFLSVSYQHQVRERERRLAEARSAALGAQVQALRYQVNPHFLFNTLNSIAALIAERDPTSAAKAERMVLDLSDFFRATLTTDMLQDITLSEEFALQSLYLQIEKVRFSDRLTVEIDLPESLAGARTPSLILQPLVENAVKHGVGVTPDAVTIRLSATAVGDEVRLTVENTAPRTVDEAARRRLRGAGVGLDNVRRRLRALFGPEPRLEAGATPDGGYAASVRLPLRAAA